MELEGLYNRIYGWIDSVLNDPEDTDPIKIHISDDDTAASESETPYITIGYTPATLTPRGSGGSQSAPKEKSAPGHFETGDTYGNLKNLHMVSTGALAIAVDGAVAVEITGLDFTEALSMTAVAIILEAEINKQIFPEKIVVEFTRGDINYFDFISTSIPDTAGGVVSSIVLSAPSTGVNLLADTYLNGGTSIASVEDHSYEVYHYSEYEGDIEIRQTYGDGELLKKLIDTLWFARVISYFHKNKFSILDKGPIQGIPFLDGNRTIKESMMTCKFYFYGVSREDVAIIENIGMDGVLENVDSSESHEISIGG